jgi:Metallopeptidase toxin 4
LVADIQYQISEKVAFLCGIWNGIIDFVGGLFLFIGQIAQLQYNIGANLEEYLERFDSFCETVSNLKWEEISKAFSKVYDDVKKYFKDSKENDFNYDKIAYFAGFSVAFIATLFIPFTAFAKPLGVINKLQKTIFPAELVQKVSQTTAKTTNFVVKATKESYETALTFIDDIISLLAKGAKGIEEFLKDIWKKIAEWFLENRKNFESLAKKIKDAFYKDGKTEELFRKIGKRMNLAGEEILSSNDLKKLRRLLIDEFKVVLELVDQNPALKTKLKDWKLRRVAGSFNMIEGVMYLRKSVTAYTVQHEMFHMQLWYKMTKEFPELQALFQKTLGREPINLNSINKRLLID